MEENNRKSFSILSKIGMELLENYGWIEEKEDDPEWIPTFTLKQFR